jgi:hypothetical protein
MTVSVAFVAKSCTPDLERCALLCRSIEPLAQGRPAAGSSLTHATRQWKPHEDAR